MGQRVERIAVLNRGEAATRCLRAIRELRTEEGSSLVGIALYTDPDRFAPFVREADEAISLGPALRRASGNGAMRPAYLDHERVLAALRATHADSVWPGWGFLAEAPEFVEKLEDLGLTFLGPSARTMRMLGDKITSKQIAERAGVPVSPWSGGPVAREDLRELAERIGFPLMLKATAGGGGRGIRMLRDAKTLETAFDSASLEAANAFGDGTLFVEKAISDARHVEVQMAADAHGTVLALGLRDCSVQRKHQKVVEEAPPPGLPRERLDEIAAASVKLLREVGYVGVATCEYLVADDAFYFLEVNPRLQVEHGLTELLTEFDLVKAQIRIARGDALPKEAPASRGCAIEVRLCAEDPASGFAPSPGRISLLDLPSGPGIRVDSGIAPGDSVPPEFDSMVAKILSRGSTREEARARIVRAVSDARVVIDGGMTNKGFLLDVLEHDAFRQGGVTTGWLDQVGLARPPAPCIEALLVAAIQVYQREREAVRANFFAAASRGRPREIPSSSGSEIDLVYAGRSYRLRVFAIGGRAYRVYMDERVMQVSLLEQGRHTRILLVGDTRHQALVGDSGVELRIEIGGRLHVVVSDVGGKVRAPAPALLIEINVQPGDRVEPGQRLGLFEAMKTETALLAPSGGTVREVVAHPGERVSAGDVILVIEPSAEGGAVSNGSPMLELPTEPDPLDVFFGPDGHADLPNASGAPTVERVAGLNALRSETRRILMGYDVNPDRADRLIEVLQAPVDRVSDALRAELAQLAGSVEIFGDVETLFSRAPTRLAGDELGPSNDARLAMYLRRITAEGAGIAPEFLDLLRRALRHYGVDDLAPDGALERAVLRVYATRTTLDLRQRLIAALLHQIIRLGEQGESFARQPELEDSLDRLGLLRAAVGPTIADLAAQARFRVFERPDASDDERPVPRADLAETLVPPPDAEGLAERAASLGMREETARRFELWRMDNFDLERIELPGFADVLAFHGRSRDGSGDERILCFAEVLDLGPDVPGAPSLPAFEERFHEAIEAMRSLQGRLDPTRRMQWNRLYVFVRPPIVLSDALLTETLRRLAPETGHLGLEKVIVRIASVNPVATDDPPRTIEVLAGNPSGSRVEWSFRQPHDRPLEPATPYERRVASARARGLVYPYEIVRLFTAPPEGDDAGVGRPIGPGDFEEYDLVDGVAMRVVRRPGQSESGIVFGVIRTPTLKHPAGMRRVLILGDPTRYMGALAAPECDRIVAALDLAEREGIPVEWVAVSAGARIAMESGTENLDATARVVRRLVTFTDGDGEVNVILPGINVGAQSYFDALATMNLRSRGILIMLANASMVLTGRAALEFSGGVAAEDEVGIGGYERIMGPNGEAHHQARDLSSAYEILLEHYACTYRAPGEASPRRFHTSDPATRDVTLAPYDGEEDFKRIGEIFSDATNAERKRPFAMRPLMRALVDADAGWLENWKDWASAEMAIVWNAHLGGFPVTMIGIESRPLARLGYTPNHGPESWTAGTLFPQSSKKVARALNAASGNRPAIVLANLSGFDGSPESMRRGILEYGAEIARAVVRFDGPLLFTVVTRYHGGAYVVFSRELNDRMRAGALTGSFASVIGGPAAAAVVFSREVRSRVEADPRVHEARLEIERAPDTASRVALRARLERVMREVTLEQQAEMAAEFDAVHSVERALQVGSLEALIEPASLRPTLIGWLSEELGARAPGTRPSR